jgi:hypothetical protein
MRESQAIVFRNSLARRFQLKGDWQAAGFFAVRAAQSGCFHKAVIGTT